jgi:hypothetical protein
VLELAYATLFLCVLLLQKFDICGRATITPTKVNVYDTLIALTRVNDSVTLEQFLTSRSSSAPKGLT